MRKILILFFFGCLAVTAFAGEESEKVKNLLKHDFAQLGSNGLPAGYKAYFDEASKGKATVSQDDGVNVVKLEMPEIGKGFLDTSYLLDLKKNKKYVLTVQLKIENQKYTGRGVHFFYVCAYNTSNGKHIYNKIVGHGSSGGWLTVVLPIDTAKRPKLVGAKLFFRGYSVSGSYWLKNPMLVEIPNNVELKAHYILENNKTIPGGFLRLGTLSKTK
jgi:hypothetical protein